MRNRTIIITVVLVLCVSSFYYPQPATAQMDIADAEVLVIIASGFGWNYFDIVETLEGGGVNVTTVSSGISLTVPSCANRDPRPVTADMFVEDLDNDTLDLYDGLVVPSGGHWDGLCSRGIVRNLLARAHERGLAIATMCIGNRVVCRPDITMNDTKVAYYGMTNSEMRNEGAIVVNGAVVVSGNGIITGGSGSGPPDGYQGAPTYLVMVEFVKEILGRSYVQSVSLEPSDGEINTEFQIIVNVQDPCSDLAGVNASEITGVSATIYSKADPTQTETITLSQIYGSACAYTANFTAPDYGEFGINIEVEDTESVFAIESDIATFEVLGAPAGLVIDPVVIGVVILVPVVAVVIYFGIKKRGAA
ncbi:MAG: DJ-1/PfpI family protein [Candidatus Thorarchaeota archaeon]|nr:DJ-1/PfpI family protein [Candidatus Thorarchaeota archaeon]